MIGGRLLKPEAAVFRKRINRAPMPIIARGVPWASVMLGSLLPALLLVVSAPVMPPLGFLVLLAWKQLRPGLLPVWAGLPLGAFDDLYSGQPFGSGVLLWSTVCIALDIIEARLPWRNYVMEWLVATALIAAYVLLALGLANLAGGSASLRIIAPQLALSILGYPLVGRLVAMLDRLRLIPFARVR